MGTQYAFGQIVTDGLVLCLNASDRNSYISGSTTWNDVSGLGNNGTLINGPTFNSLNGGSIVFDGVNDLLQANAVNSSYFTLSVWAKWTQFFSSNQGHSLVSNNTSTSNGYMLYQGTSDPYNRVTLFVCTPSLVSFTSNTSLSTNVWYNIVGTYDGNLISLYINGDLDKNTTQTGTVTSNPGSLLVGKTSYTNAYFNGNISNIQIYNRALSAQEVLQNYNATKSRFGIT
jgi:hypothetical protein